MHCVLGSPRGARSTVASCVTVQSDSDETESRGGGAGKPPVFTPIKDEPLTEPYGGRIPAIPALKSPKTEPSPHRYQRPSNLGLKVGVGGGLELSPAPLLPPNFNTSAGGGSNSSSNGSGGFTMPATTSQPLYLNTHTDNHR